jgi:hypothetical protein
MKPVAQPKQVKDLSNAFPDQNYLKDGKDSSLLLFTFTLEYAIREV